MTIDDKTKRAILEEILKSNSFKNSKLNSKLLTYLVESSIENKTPNEFTIAIDVFNKDSSFNPTEDTIVRVSVYNLRKKLERYYQNMGKKSKVRVKIPKGHYEVQFFYQNEKSLSEKLKNPYFTLGSIILFLLIVIVYLLLNKSPTVALTSPDDNTARLHSLFAAFVNSPNPKLISLGDDFIYYSDFSEFNTTSTRKMYRDSKINNEKDFEKFKSEDPARNEFKKLPFSFFNQAAVWPLPYVVKILYRFGTEYTIKSASTLNSNDLKKNDILFLGSFWTLGILDKVIKDLNIEYNVIGEEKLILKKSGNSDSTMTFVRTGIPAYDHIDYSLLIKVPGPNKNTFYLIVSFYATGSVGAVKFISNADNLKKISKKFKDLSIDFNDYYIILFKSTGYARDVLSTEIVNIAKINPGIVKW